MYEVDHCHYIRLDPFEHPRPALFKIRHAGHLVAVVREPFGEPLVNEPEPDAFYRVDCAEELSDELKGLIASYLPLHPARYFVNGGWSWRDNGTHEAMPW